VTTAAPPARGPSVIEAAQQAIEHTRRRLFLSASSGGSCWMRGLPRPVRRHPGCQASVRTGELGGSSGGGGSDEATPRARMAERPCRDRGRPGRRGLAIVVVSIVLWLTAGACYAWTTWPAPTSTPMAGARGARPVIPWSSACRSPCCDPVRAAGGAGRGGGPGDGAARHRPHRRHRTGRAARPLPAPVVSAALASSPSATGCPPRSTGRVLRGGDQLLLALVAHPGTFVVSPCSSRSCFAIALSLVTLVAAC
jgi:hypothetical protein